MRQWQQALVGSLAALVASFLFSVSLDAADPKNGQGQPTGEAGGPAVIAATTPSAPPPASPAKTAPAAPSSDAAETNPTKPSRVANYRIEVDLDPVKHRLVGHARLRWTNASRRPQREVFLHLYLNAFRDRLSTFNRSTAGSGFRGNPVGGGWGHTDVSAFVFEGVDLWPKRQWAALKNPDDRTDARLELPRPVAPGETVEFQFDWTAQLPRVRLRTGYVGNFHMVAQWFPKIARLEPDGRWAHFPFERLSEFYADFGDYDVTIRVPEGYVVAASGTRKSQESKGNQRQLRYVAAAVHDFAFCAWDRFEELRQKTTSGVKLRILYPPGQESLARRELEMAERGLAHFSERYGAYPYSNLTLVRPPEGAREAGAMEYPTLITTGATGRYRWLGSRRLEGLVLHELAHQWFYGILASNEHRFPFLDEGLATYAQMEAAESFWPQASAGEWLGFRIGLPGALRTAAAQGQFHGVVARSAADFETGKDYGRLVYSRTAIALLSVARLWGKLRLQAALRSYAMQYRFAHPNPENLLSSIAKEVGADAEKFMRAVLFDGAFVDIAVEEFGQQPGPSKGPDGAAPSSAMAGQSSCFVVVRRAGSLDVPVEVDVRLEDGNRRRLRWRSDTTHGTLRFSCAAPIVSVVVDPELRLLLDGDLSNNVKRRGKEGLSVRTLARLQAIGHLLQWVATP